MIDKIKPSFYGLWENLKPQTKETGELKRGSKEYYKVYPRIYHPFEDETPEQISEALEGKTWGRSFCVSSRHDGTIDRTGHLQMNYAKEGDKIQKEDKAYYINNEGYKEEFQSGILDDREFYDTYTNAIYLPYDVYRMDANYVKDFVGRHFTKLV